MVAKKRKAQCMVPKCTNPQRCRGMCESCYRWALRLVEAKKRTWAFFEKKGWARPKGEPGRPRTNSLDKALEDSE